MKTRRTGSGVSSVGVAKLASGIPLLLLAFAAACVAIAGLSVVRHEAGSDSIYQGLGFSWFVIAASFFVLLAVLVYLFGTGLAFVASSHSAIVGLLAVTTVLTIFQTRDWNDNRKQQSYSTKLGKGAVTTFAGFLSLAVLQALLIMILGNAATARRGRDVDAYQTSNVHTNPVGTTPTPAVATHTAV